MHFTTGAHVIDPARAAPFENGGNGSSWTARLLDTSAIPETAWGYYKPWPIATPDIDRDGDLDVVAGCRFGAGDFDAAGHALEVVGRCRECT